MKTCVELINKAKHITIGETSMVLLEREDFDELIQLVQHGISAELALEKISLCVRQETANENKSQHSQPKLNPQDLLTQHEVANEWGISAKALEKWRLTGDGPKYIKIGTGLRSTIRYRRLDLTNFLADRERTSTTHDTAIRQGKAMKA